jgi:hypothetical protein
MSASKPLPGVRDLACVAGLLLIGCRLAQALGHLRDLSGIQHLAGIWMALAAYLEQGVFYPPLEADGFYAGTRYMPLLFGVIAGFARLVGDYLVAAKLAALFSMGLLLAGVFVAVRRLTGRFVDAIGFSALVLAFPEGESGLLSPHADALPVALAVWGLLLLDREGVSARRVIGAAILFAVAVAAKFSAAAGPAAGAIILWQKGHRRLAVLGLALFVGLVGLEIAAIQWGSDGRFLETFRALGSGGMSAESIRIGPNRLRIALFQVSPFLLVWPVAFFLLVRRLLGHKPDKAVRLDGGEETPAREGEAPAEPRGRIIGGASLLQRAGTRLGRSLALPRDATTSSVIRPSLSMWEWYLLMALGTTLVIFTSPGTGFNHLLELEAACVLVLARGADSATIPLRQGLALVVLILGLWMLAGPTDPAGVSPSVLAEAFAPTEKILSEDASVPVLLGQRPVVMDPFAFRVLAERGFIDDRALAERIDKQEFDVVVMLNRFDRPESLCPRFHFGPRVTDSLRRAYQFDRQVGGYYVFRRVRAALACRPCRPCRSERPRWHFSRSN